MASRGVTPTFLHDFVKWLTALDRTDDAFHDAYFKNTLESADIRRFTLLPCTSSNSHNNILDVCLLLDVLSGAPYDCSSSVR